jgi:hypothetical protein
VNEKAALGRKEHDQQGGIWLETGSLGSDNQISKFYPLPQSMKGQSAITTFKHT